MTDSDDMQEVTRGLEQAFGPRREPEDAAQPVYGEARPVPPQRYELRLPLSHAWAYLVLLTINIAIYAVPALLDMVGVQVLGLSPSLLIRALGAKINQAISVDGEYYRFLTAMFLHGGLLHILFNSYALYILGQETERIFGTARFLGLYFIAGFAGGLASYAFSPAPSVGASGAIFGLIGGLAAFFYQARNTLGQMARQQLGSLITIIMINLFIGFSAPQIDNWAHMGGLVGGLVVGWLLAPRFVVDTRLFPPVMARQVSPLGWAGAVGVFVLLAVAAVTIPPAT